MGQNRSLKIIPMSETHGKAICEWRYDPPYHIYNWRSWDEMKAAGEEFADSEIRDKQYGSVIDEQGILCGFVQFFPMDGVIRIGLGLHPQICGIGIGASLMKVIVEEAKKRAPSTAIDLEVLTWNHRAYKVYERAGFEYEQTYERMTPTGMMTFHCMVYAPACGDET